MGKKTKQDPTGQASNRRASLKPFVARLNRAQREIVSLFREIPVTRTTEAVVTNATIAAYDYQITPQELLSLAQSVREILNIEILETQTTRMPPNWWWQDEVEVPYRQGTGEELVEFNQIVRKELIRIRREEGRVIQRPELLLDDVVNSEAYQSALQNTYIRNFGDFAEMTQRTSQQVVREINDGIASRLSPREITDLIDARFDVARSSAKRIVDTEVNRAYNDARLNTTDIAAQQTGLRAAVLHLSALLPTTRAGHAERHGDAYTTTQQRQWWNEGSNRINCHCSTRSVLVDEQNRIIDVELQEEIQAEREFFDE